MVKPLKGPSRLRDDTPSNPPGGRYSAIPGAVRDILSIRSGRYGMLNGEALKSLQGCRQIQWLPP